MNVGDKAVRAAGPIAARVLEALADSRRRSISVAEDRAWLSQWTKDPNALLESMADSQLLYRVGRGRYVVAPRGTFSATQAAPAELIAALILGARGDYFISYLTALIDYRLTDLHSTTIYAAIRQDGTFDVTSVALPDGTLQLVRLSPRNWPVDRDRELTRVRALADTKEFIWRATMERALADSLSRPDLAAGLETVVGCWARARQSDADWDLVCAICARRGRSMERRCALLLRLLGLDAVAKRNFPNLSGRGASTPLDRSNSFELSPEQITRDRDTGVLLNVPEDHLRGWIAAAATP
jgi:predicted transcriptional regulator of viral defense system